VIDGLIRSIATIVEPRLTTLLEELGALDKEAEEMLGPDP
jgi:hypothetical protein